MKTESSGAAFTHRQSATEGRERESIRTDFNTKALRRTVHEFYREKKYPTLESLLVAVKETAIFTGDIRRCGRSYIRWASSIRK